MESITEQLAYVAHRMFERRLTDMAGGNISARQGSLLYISPRFSGSRKHWQLDPEDFIECEVASDDILSDARFSREGKAHLAVYRAIPDVGAIIHAHPFHVLPFCAASRAIEPVLEATQKFGVVDVVQGAPAHSQDLADNIVAGLRGKEDRVRKQAAAVLMPEHGIFVAGKDLLATIDALERIDWNAWCILAQNLMPKG
jgi:L-fuculose-phosphate aldolase